MSRWCRGSSPKRGRSGGGRPVSHGMRHGTPRSSAIASRHTYRHSYAKVFIGSFGIPVKGSEPRERGLLGPGVGIRSITYGPMNERWRERWLCPAHHGPLVLGSDKQAPAQRRKSSEMTTTVIRYHNAELGNPCVPSWGCSRKATTTDVQVNGRDLS